MEHLKLFNKGLTIWAKKPPLLDSAVWWNTENVKSAYRE